MSLPYHLSQNSPNSLMCQRFRCSQTCLMSRCSLMSHLSHDFPCCPRCRYCRLPQTYRSSRMNRSNQNCQMSLPFRYGLIQDGGQGLE